MKKIFIFVMLFILLTVPTLADTLKLTIPENVDGKTFSNEDTFTIVVSYNPDGNTDIDEIKFKIKDDPKIADADVANDGISFNVGTSSNVLDPPCAVNNACDTHSLENNQVDDDGYWVYAETSTGRVLGCDSNNMPDATSEEVAASCSGTVGDFNDILTVEASVNSIPADGVISVLLEDIIIAGTQYGDDGVATSVTLVENNHFTVDYDGAKNVISFEAAVLNANGQDCTSDDECQSGYCDGNVCAAADGPCQTHQNCNTGYCDIVNSNCQLPPDCTDSDGNNPNEKGIASGIYQNNDGNFYDTKTDYCDANKLIEYTCDDKFIVENAPLDCPDGTCNDGVCEGADIPVLGCTNPAAENYDPTANEDDGSCKVVDAGAKKDGGDYNGDGKVDGSDLVSIKEDLPGFWNFIKGLFDQETSLQKLTKYMEEMNQNWG